MILYYIVFFLSFCKLLVFLGLEAKTNFSFCTQVTFCMRSLNTKIFALIMMSSYNTIYYHFFKTHFFLKKSFEKMNLTNNFC